MKKILFLTHENIDNTAVAKAMFYDLAIKLKNKFEVCVFSASSLEDDKKPDSGINNVYFERNTQGRFSFSDFWLLSKSFKAVNKLINANDIVYIRSYPMAIFMYFSLRYAKARIIFDTRGLFFEELFDSNKLQDNRLLRYIFRVLERKLLENSDVVICVSEAQKKYYLALTSSVKYEVIYNATDWKKSKNIVSVHKYTIGYVGSLVSWHLPERTNSILKICEDKGLDFEFHCITRDIEKATSIFGNLKYRKIYSHAYRKEPLGFDLGMCLIMDTLSKKVCFPVKFSEYISAGVNVAFSCNVDVCQKIHKLYNIGLEISLDDSNEKIAEEIVEYLTKNQKILSLPRELNSEHTFGQIECILSYE